jgi:imidazolonepropionase-like amidohydrolase
MRYLLRGKKLVTVSRLGTIENGAMLIHDDVIKRVGSWETLSKKFPSVAVLDYSNYVITPSLVDCHTHLLEFAPTSLYPVTPETHFWAGKSILFQALSSGITALGEQICGHPLCDFTIEEYRKAVIDIPMDISFATTSITIGFETLAHFTSVTKSQSINKTELIDPKLVMEIAQNSDYPGENIFINATPANFTNEMVPRAGEIIYSLEELKEIVQIYHILKKEIGCHVAGEEGIQLALDAGVDVLHHAHGITDEQIQLASDKNIRIVATPMGGTHLLPNSPEEIARLVQKGIAVSISTDSYLPPHPDAKWLPFKDQSLQGPEVLMQIARPAMKFMEKKFNENDILSLITANPAHVLGKENQFGRLEPGLEANFLVAEGIPGLDFTEVSGVKKVFYKGNMVIDKP